MNDHQPSTRTLAKQYGLFHGDITAFSLKHHCTRLEAIEILKDQQLIMERFQANVRSYLSQARQQATT